MTTALPATALRAANYRIYYSSLKFVIVRRLVLVRVGRGIVLPTTALLLQLKMRSGRKQQLQQHQQQQHHHHHGALLASQGRSKSLQQSRSSSSSTSSSNSSSHAEATTVSASAAAAAAAQAHWATWSHLDASLNHLRAISKPKLAVVAVTTVSAVPEQ